MKAILGTVKSFTSGAHDNDDFVDRLSNRYSVMILVVSALIISTQLYVGSPITCWAPKHFTGNWIKYTNSYCWVKNTYYLPMSDEIPKAHEAWKRHTIVYYQWIPFILAAQAFMFYFPSFIWHGFNNRAGVDCDDILKTANKLLTISDEKTRKSKLLVIRKQLHRFLKTRKPMELMEQDGTTSRAMIRLRMLRENACCLSGKRLGNYLCILFMFTKLAYFGNVIGQLYMLNHILRTDYSLYGWEFFSNIVEDNFWINAVGFPRVTMCDFNIRRLGNLQRYTVQCVLPINMYTEKIYAFLWFWMVIVAIMTAFNFFIWMFRFLAYKEKVNYIKGHLRTVDREDADAKDSKLTRTFLTNYLRPDGLFVIRLIGHNTNSITVSEVLSELWNGWKDDFLKNN